MAYVASGLTRNAFNPHAAARAAAEKAKRRFRETGVEQDLAPLVAAGSEEGASRTAGEDPKPIVPPEPVDPDGTSAWPQHRPVRLHGPAGLGVAAHDAFERVQ